LNINSKMLFCVFNSMLNEITSMNESKKWKIIFFHHSFLYYFIFADLEWFLKLFFFWFFIWLSSSFQSRSYVSVTF
jgi:hypothetical protein